MNNRKKGVSEDLSNINKSSGGPQPDTEPKNNVFDFNQLRYSVPEYYGSNDLSGDIEILFHTRLQHHLQ